jgi:ArsR family transcriptional regulator
MDNRIIKLKGLADKNRYQIVNLLQKHDFCVGALAHNLKISKAAVSQHLQILRKAGIVIGEKRGYWTHYSVNKKVLYEIADELKNLADQPPSIESVCFKKCPGEDSQHQKGGKNMCKGQCEHPETK